MNDPTLTPNDPRLTAYALGELSGDARAHIEAALRENPALRVTVDEIRATAAHLEAALAAEAAEDQAAVEAEFAGSHQPFVNGHAAADRLNGAEAVRILPGRDPRKLDGGDVYARPARGAKLLQFPQLYVIIGMAAAACVAVMVVLRNDELRTKQDAGDAVARIARKKAADEWRAGQPTIVTVSNAPLRETSPSPEPAREVSRAAESRGPIPVTEPDRTAVAVAEPPIPARAPEPTDNQLGLLEITKPNAGPAGDASTTARTLVDRAARPMETAPVAAGPATTPASASPAAPLQAQASGNNAAPPPASAGAGSGFSPATAVTVFTGPANTTPPVDDDIVRLDAFEVNADRIQSFVTSSAFTHFTTITRGMPEPEPLPRPPLGAQFGREKDLRSYAGDNEFVRTSDTPVSKFSLEVDTASYANVRRMIEQGTKPTRDAVRIEELVNYFPYAYPAPQDNAPFAAALEVAAAPWSAEHRLVRIGLKAREIATAQRGPANLVFLLDVSASMGEPNKLPLVRESVWLLVNKLRPDDRVAIVTYAGTSVVALQPTPVARAGEILAALNALRPAGTTDGAGGLQLAYQVAISHFTHKGVNRVILCTDGAFNAGMTSERQLLHTIDEKTRSGIALTVLGFGKAHEHSTPLERLAHKANATYGYIDSRREAEKFLVEQLSSSLATIARDVKVEVEFNPAKVLAYRLIGYENRPLRREDYSEERGAMGEVGAGQTVTALYEIVPALPNHSASTAANSDYVRYGAQGAVSSRLEMPETRKPPGPELLTVNVHSRNPNAIIGWPRNQQFALVDRGAEFADASADFRFAAAVAEFGMILRGSPHKGSGSLRDVIAWANSAANPSEDPRGYRRDFISLARKTQSLLR